MLIQTFSFVIPPKFLHVLQMPSHFLDLPFLGFFSSRFILCQLLVPLQPPESQQKPANPELPPSHTHKTSLSSRSYCLSVPAIFLFCQVSSSVSNTQFVCLSHHRQLGWHRNTPSHQKKGARKETQRLHREAANSISHASSRASHLHPKPNALLTLFPI